MFRVAKNFENDLPSLLKIAGIVVVLIWSMVSRSFAQPNWLQEVVQNSEGISGPEEAAAIVLHKTARVEISAYRRAQTHIRLAFKILKPLAEKYGVLSEYVTPFRKVKKLKGWVALPDGSWRTLSKENVTELSMQRSTVFYDESRVLLANLTDIEVGAVIAFQYNIEQDDWSSFYQRFVFQKQQPVKFAQFSVILPKGWQLNKADWHTDGVVFEQKGNRYVWTAHDLPYQPEEPLIPSWFSPFKQVSVACYNSSLSQSTQFVDWASVARWYAELYRPLAAPDEPLAAYVHKLIRGLTTPEEKLQAIAEFVRDEIRYVAIEIGKGRWQPRAAPTTLRNRFGDCKDKTTLMRAMLQVAGIPSVPVLANTRYPVQPELPTPFQFSHCIIGIPLEKEQNITPKPDASVDEWLFFDPTDPSTRLGALPQSLQGGTVLLATEADSVLYRLPFRSSENYRRRYRAEANLAADGSFSAEVMITDFGNWATESCYQRNMTPPNKQIEKWRTLLSQTVPTAILSNYQTGVHEDSAWVSFQLKGGRHGTQAGTLYLLKPDFFHADEPPAFTADQRQHPIWLGPPMQIETDIIWHLPSRWIAEANASTLRNTCSIASFSCEIVLEDHSLRFKSVLRYTGQVLPPEHYSAARDFSQGLSAVRGLIIALNQYQNCDTL